MKKILGKRGFTLIELLVAITIFGLILTGMYTAFSSMQKTTVNQSNLVDVQQNLRVSVEMISKDIKLAAALVPSGTTGVTSGSNATTLNLATVSSFYAYARIADDVEIPAGGGNDVDFTITVPTSVDNFAAGHTIRIVRPQNGVQPYDATAGNDLIVDSVDRTGPTIKIDNFANATAVQYKAGDIIARVGAAAPDPSTIVWDQSGNDLRRNRDNSGVEIMANDIRNLTFAYFDENGNPINLPLTTTDLDDIRSVSVNITADATRQLDGQTRPRSISSIIYLRN